MKTFSVYTLSSPADDRVRYVGMTCKSLKCRLAGHLCRPRPHMKNWIAALRRESLHPEINLVVSDLTLDQASEMEIQLIQYLRNIGVKLLNSSSGGESGSLGCKSSVETRAKISSSLIGNKNCLGYIHSRETRAKMSRNKNALGHKHSVGTRSRMSLAKTGKYLSAEHRANMSASQILRAERRRQEEILSVMWD